MEFSAVGEKVHWLSGPSVTDTNNPAELPGDNKTQLITEGEQGNVTDRSMTPVTQRKSRALGYVALQTITVICGK